VKDQAAPQEAGEKVGVVLCSCGGTLFSAAQGEKIASGIYGGEGAPAVFLSQRACDPGETKALARDLRRQRIAKAVFVGCSLRERQELFEGLARKSGLTPSSLRNVALREPSFLRLSRRDATRHAVSLTHRALRALSLQPSFQMRRVPMAPEVLVIGDGPAGREAARAARALGHPTALVSAGATAAGPPPAGQERPSARSRLLSLEGQVGAFHVRIQTPSEVQTVDVGAVIVADGAAPEPEDWLKAVAGDIRSGRPCGRTDGQPLGAEAVARPVLALSDLAAAVEALPRRSAVRPIGILLDLEIDESRAATETALGLALRLQSRDRVQVYLFCRDVRVTALPLEGLYDQAREAGMAVVAFTGVPRLEPGLRGVTVTVQDAVLGETVSLDCDLLGVSPSGIAAQAAGYRDLAALIGVSTDGLGRLQENNINLLPEKTNRPGVFVVGTCRGEDYLPQQIREAQAAALAAHELLSVGRAEVELSQPVVDADKCALCLTCVRSCPFHAMRVAAGKSVAESLPEVCQRCGTCAGECPAKAIELPVYSDRILLSLLA
jgi:heterodisulfide reductase subunit A-like polyferredoxin